MIVTVWGHSPMIGEQCDRMLHQPPLSVYVPLQLFHYKTDRLLLLLSFAVSLHTVCVHIVAVVNVLWE